MKKMKAALLLCMVAILAAGLIGCGMTDKKQENNNASPSPGASAGATESAKPKDVITLKASSPAPQKAGHSRGFDAYLDEIEKRSDGRIKFERFYGGSLVKAGVELDALSSGIVDVAMFTPSYVPGRLPLATIGTNPSLWGDSWVGAKAFNELYQTVPEMQQELEKQGVKFVGQYALTTGYVISKKPVKSLADLKGLKVVANGQLAPLAQQLGASPVSMPVEETYEAMTRGVIDGLFYGLVEAQTFGLVDAVEYVYKLPVGSSAGLIGMNLGKWKNLPEDLQKMIAEVASEYHPGAYHDIYQVEAGGAALKALEAKGANIIEPTAEDVAKMKQIASDTVIAEWVKDKESKGLPGQKVVDTMIQAIQKYEKENPYK